jgi:gas vesicle protein
MDITSLLIGLVIGCAITAIVFMLKSQSDKNAEQTNEILKNNEIERLEMRIAELEKQIKERTASYEKYYNEVKSLDKLNDNLDDKIAKLQKEVRRLTEENNKYSSQIYEYKNTVASLEAELRNK